MDLEAFRASLGDAEPPTSDPALQALWQEANGDWDAAHELSNQAAGPRGAWVHAYLHRVEGDLSNADYWYRRAGRERPAGDTAREWGALVTALLELVP